MIPNFPNRWEMSKYTWKRYGILILDRFWGIQGSSGWEIGQIWPKIATKLAEIRNFLNNDNLNDP